MREFGQVGAAGLGQMLRWATGSERQAGVEQRLNEGRCPRAETPGVLQTDHADRVAVSCLQSEGGRQVRCGLAALPPRYVSGDHRIDLSGVSDADDLSSHRAERPQIGVGALPCFVHDQHIGTDSVRVREQPPRRGTDENCASVIRPPRFSSCHYGRASTVGEGCFRLPDQRCSICQRAEPTCDFHGLFSGLRRDTHPEVCAMGQGGGEQRDQSSLSCARW